MQNKPCTQCMAHPWLRVRHMQLGQTFRVFFFLIIIHGKHNNWHGKDKQLSLTTWKSDNKLLIINTAQLAGWTLTHVCNEIKHLLVELIWHRARRLYTERDQHGGENLSGLTGLIWALSSFLLYSMMAWMALPARAAWMWVGNTYRKSWAKMRSIAINRQGNIQTHIKKTSTEVNYSIPSWPGTGLKA